MWSNLVQTVKKHSEMGSERIFTDYKCRLSRNNCSPTARITSDRMLMQLAVQDKLVVHHMYVKIPYLNAIMDCELYIEQPERFEQQGENGARLMAHIFKNMGNQAATATERLYPRPSHT